MKPRFTPRIEAKIFSQANFGKIVEFLRHNSMHIMHVGDTAYPFAFQIERYTEIPELQSSPRLPSPPFDEGRPERFKYSSGSFW